VDQTNAQYHPDSPLLLDHPLDASVKFHRLSHPVDEKIVMKNSIIHFIYLNNQIDSLFFPLYEELMTTKVKTMSYSLPLSQFASIVTFALYFLLLSSVTIVHG
jgi:hypothetical protein